MLMSRISIRTSNVKKWKVMSEQENILKVRTSYNQDGKRYFQRISINYDTTGKVSKSLDKYEIVRTKHD